MVSLQLPREYLFKTYLLFGTILFLVVLKKWQQMKVSNLVRNCFNKSLIGSDQIHIKDLTSKIGPVHTRDFSIISIIRLALRYICKQKINIYLFNSFLYL